MIIKDREYREIEDVVYAMIIGDRLNWVKRSMDVISVVLDKDSHPIIIVDYDVSTEELWIQSTIGGKPLVFFCGNLEMAEALTLMLSMGMKYKPMPMYQKSSMIY